MDKLELEQEFVVYLEKHVVRYNKIHFKEYYFTNTPVFAESTRLYVNHSLVWKRERTETPFFRPYGRNKIVEYKDNKAFLFRKAKQEEIDKWGRINTFFISFELEKNVKMRIATDNVKNIANFNSVIRMLMIFDGIIICTTDDEITVRFKNDVKVNVKFKENDDKIEIVNID